MKRVRLDSCALVVCWVGLLTTCAMSQEAAKQPEPGMERATSVAAGTTPSCQCIDDIADSTTKAQIEKALREPLHAEGLDFTDQPMQEVATYLADEYKVPIYLDTESLSDAGLSPDEPVNIHLHGISLRSALRLLLKAHGLTYVVRDEVIAITTPETAASQLTICVYDVRDLVTPRDETELVRLVDAIVACVAHDSWGQNGGGQSQIRALQPGVLIVSQTESAHRQIGALLGAVRRIKNGDSSAATMMGGRGGYGMMGREGEAPVGEGSGYGARGEMGGAFGRGHNEELFGPAENPVGEAQSSPPAASDSLLESR